MVASLPIVGGYSEYIVMASNELVPVHPGLDPAEAVSLVLNYITAYQMLHRCAHIKPSEIILIKVIPKHLEQEIKNNFDW